MKQSIAFLGRQPKISLAELESVLGADAIMEASDLFARLNIDSSKVPYPRLGGTSKLAKVLTSLETTDLKQIEKFLTSACTELVESTEGKINIGFSDYGLNLSSKQLQRLGLSVKSAIKKSGKSVRLVPSKTSTLSDAQVLHNKLTVKGFELCLIRSGDQTIIAQTTNVQDLDAYTYRDRGRPARDAKVGMLPPKLAQIITNLATGKIMNEDRRSKTVDNPETSAFSPQPSVLVMDPFCGTGVLLQEAALMGYGVYGIDIEPRMVDYTTQNLDWLEDKFNIDLSYKIEVGDATKHCWDTSKIQDPNSKLFIACETYLGKPLFNLPLAKELERIVEDVDELHAKFLKNIASQTESGLRMCIAVPAWALPDGSFKHLPILDSLEEIGYNRLDFVNAKANDLIYHRPGQVVARELLVLTRK